MTLGLAAGESRATAPETALAPSPVSVVILGTRPRLLELCLRSLAVARRSPAEVLVVLNGRVELPAGWAEEARRLLPGLRLLELPRSPLGRARNAAVAAAREGLLCFLDDDVTVPPDYFEVLLRKLEEHPEAAVLGGPNLTPGSSTPFQRCQGLLLASRLGAGPMRRRYAGFERDTWTDDRGLILCNLCVRREALRRTGLSFDEELERNEENLLLAELLRRGFKALHSPELRVLHERRPDLASFCRQCFLSGRGRGQMTLRMPGSLRGRFLPPALLAACAAAAPFFPRLAVPALALYAALAAAGAAGAVRSWGPGAAPKSPEAALPRDSARSAAAAFARLCLLFPAAHLSYGLGLLEGLARRRARR